MQASHSQTDRVLEETFITSLRFAPRMDSTNDVALELVRQESTETPLLVWTHRQTAGRGRGSNRWWTSDGALTFSLVLDVDEGKLPPARRPQISLVAGLAVCRNLQGLAPELPIGLKWPNDVLVANRKICGILVEVPPSASRRVVIGVGLNVNNLLASAPGDLSRTATSLRDETERPYELTDVLIRLLQCFEAEWSQWESNGRHVFERWQTHCVLTGRQVVLEAAGREIRGRCLGIDEEGTLQVDTGQAVERLHGGHVKTID